MKPKKRQKLCYNCEGEVDLDVIVCPFCAADLREPQQKTSFSPTAHSVTQLQTEQSLYPPPYSKPQETALPLLEEETPVAEEPSSSKSSLLAIGLVSFGMQFLMLSLLMLFCSHEGVLLLKWNAHTWFLYFFASAPLLYFGYRALNKL